MYLPDINFWLALVFEVHVHHIQAKAWFDEAGADSCAFCRFTQQGFLRLATKPAVFKKEAVTMSAAWSFYDRLIEDERIYYMQEPEELEKAWRGFTRNRKYSHKVWNDAYLAAFSQKAGLKIVTFGRGFRTYKDAEITELSE
jgi:toxin-antitoxin system PIN domain toxin